MSFQNPEYKSGLHIGMVSTEPQKDDVPKSDFAEIMTGKQSSLI